MYPSAISTYSLKYTLGLSSARAVGVNGLWCYSSHTRDRSAHIHVKSKTKCVKEMIILSASMTIRNGSASLWYLWHTYAREAYIHINFLAAITLNFRVAFKMDTNVSRIDKYRSDLPEVINECWLDSRAAVEALMHHAQKFGRRSCSLFIQRNSCRAPGNFQYPMTVRCRQIAT